MFIIRAIAVAFAMVVIRAGPAGIMHVAARWCAPLPPALTRLALLVFVIVAIIPFSLFALARFCTVVDVLGMFIIRAIAVVAMVVIRAGPAGIMLLVTLRAPLPCTFVRCAFLVIVIFAFFAGALTFLLDAFFGAHSFIAKMLSACIGTIAVTVTGPAGSMLSA